MPRAGLLSIHARDPSWVLDKARDNIARLRRTRGRGANARWLSEWEVLLGGPVLDVLDALTSRTPKARELRQNSPFAGVPSVEERQRVLQGLDATQTGPSRETR